MSKSEPTAEKASHLVPFPAAKRSLCGVKDPLPKVLTRYAQAHIDGYGMKVCQLCSIAGAVGSVVAHWVNLIADRPSAGTGA
jgi:hypothetical protein